MRTSRVAVIGGGLGGMTAAGLLSRRGHAVTLFEAGPALGGKAGTFTHQGISLDTGPTLLTLPDLVRETFESLGATDLLPRFFELEEQCRYLFDDACGFSAYRDIDRTAASAREIRPHEAQGIYSFYREAKELHRAAGEPYLEAPYEGFPGFMGRVARRGLGAVARGLKMGSLQELGERHFRTDHLRQFVGRFATYAGASPTQASAAFALIPHLERTYGVHHVEGGLGALTRALEQALRRHAVQLRLGTKATVTPQGSRFLVDTVQGQEEFDAVVVNADPLKYLAREAEPLALSGYVLFLEVKGRPALPHHSVLFSADSATEFAELTSGRVPHDPTLYVCHPGATDPSMVSDTASGLYVMANAPSLSLLDEPRAAERWAAAGPLLQRSCLDRVLRAFPELAGKVRVLGERTPADFLAMGAPGGSLYGFLPVGALGPFRRPRMRGKVPGMFFAGGGTHPGGGVPLVMLSGRFAAQLAASHLEKVTG